MMNQNDVEKRIVQWEKMTREDPENAMGWFSLGNAYKEAGREDEAARALRKTIELDDGFSRAYQLLGQLLVSAGAKGPAAEVLTKGYVVAAKRGDVMPQRAMGSLLEKVGSPIPEVEAAPVTPQVSGEAIVDRRTGQEGTRMSDAPMRGPVGAYIAQHYSQETWREWIRMGTKVINEMRLDFSKLEDQAVYERAMMEWLGFTQEEVDAG